MVVKDDVVRPIKIKEMIKEVKLNNDVENRVTFFEEHAFFKDLYTYILRKVKKHIAVKMRIKFIWAYTVLYISVFFMIDLLLK